MEIGRKFIVLACDWQKLRTYVVKRIIQGHLSLEPEVRVRMVGEGETVQPQQKPLPPGEKFDQAFFTTKTGEGLVRTEVEKEIPVTEADDLMQKTLLGTKRIRKIRFTVGRWEIDLYQLPWDLRGLCIAEVELTTPSEPLPELPEWLVLGKEVTEDKTYKDKSLARNGLPKDHPSSLSL